MLTIFLGAAIVTTEILYILYIYIYIYIFIDPDQFVILNNGNTTHVIGPNFFNS